jgi:D-3-phosphoglycerate dehydrogenase / 2-oxoglutarate reductase
MIKILITTSSFGKLDQTPLQNLEKAGCQVELNPFGRKLTEAEISQLIKEIQPNGMVAGVEPLTAKVLQQATQLKVISRCGIGMDSVDLIAAQKLGIKVTNTPDAPTIPVAELTLGMMLSLLRQIHLSDAGIKRGTWERPMGSLLYQKTVGLIGCGRIGSYVAKLVSAFGSNVIGYDPICQSNEYYRCVELENLLAQADIVNLHLPYSTANHHYINQEKIERMKPGSLLINTARGGLIDEKALYMALQSGHIAGAAIDSFEQEPYSGHLKNLTNVLLTGHIGSYAKEGRVMMEQQAVDNLLANLL